MAEKDMKSCVFCDKKLPTAEELRVHLKEHQKGKGSRGTRVVHRLTALSGSVTTKTTRCDECSNSFPSVTMALQHKFKVHPRSQKRYSCGFCGKNFLLKAAIDDHVGQEHADGDSNLSLKCAGCCDEFYNLEALNYHVRTFHQRSMEVVMPIQTPPPSRKIKSNMAGEIAHVLYCHLCGCEYMVKFNLQTHLKDAHTDEERMAVPKEIIKCDQCSAMFFSKKAFDTHLTYHRPDDLYATEEGQNYSTRIDCDFSYSRVVYKEPKKPKELLESIFGHEFINSTPSPVVKEEEASTSACTSESTKRAATVKKESGSKKRRKT